MPVVRSILEVTQVTGRRAMTQPCPDLVTRDVAVADRRQVYITLTPPGEALLEQLSLVHKTELQRLGPELQALLARL